MRKYFNNYIAIASLAVTTLLASCTKEAGVFKEGGSDGIVEIADLNSRTSSTLYAQTSKSFDTKPEVDCPITFNVTGVNGAEEDITINWDFNNTAVTTSSSSYTVLPANLIIAPATKTVVIPKGKKTATIVLKLKTDQFDFSKNYGMGIEIKSISSGTLSGNYSVGVVLVSAKNFFDGVYTVTGTLNDLTTSSITGLYPMKGMSLITTGANTSVMYNSGGYGSSGYLHPIMSGTSTSSYGSFSPIFEIDQNTGNVLSVKNYFGQPASGATARSGQLDPAGVNKYDAATKTLEVSYFMLESGNVRTKFQEKWVHTGSRK